MPVLRNPATGDVHTVGDELADYYTRQGWLPAGSVAVTEAEEAHELKGAALDEALDRAGLSKSGTADEKRARLADHTTEQEQ
jgi:hypothetical protein